MKITFLEGAKRLAKKFTNERVEPYPLVKTVTSHSYELPPTLEGLREKFSLMKSHAAQGHALLKGNLKRPITRESRAGLADKDELAYNIVLDIDGLRFLPCEVEGYNTSRVRDLAEKVIAMLPADFKNISYIAHASASLGMKPGETSLHIDFILTTPVPVAMLKLYLQSLNLDIGKFDSQLELTASGNALKYKLDICLADNSRIIFIAPPTFDGVSNPFDDDDDRFILVEKAAASIELADTLSALDANKIQRRVSKKVESLRSILNLPRMNTKTQTVRVQGQAVNVVTNPSMVDMEFSYENGPFVYYNINGGNSNAYYVRKDAPAIVYNFKGEPNFLFEQASPEMFKEHLERFGFGEDSEEDPDNKEPATVPIVFRDLHTNSFYQALYIPSEKILDKVYPGDRAACEDFLRERGELIPDVIQGLRFEFAPNDKRTVDIPGEFINRYTATKFIRKPVELGEQYNGIGRGLAATPLSELCPTIYKVIHSICGNSSLEFEHFINWLAFVINEKEKSKTAWVMHGVPGTGKGVFFDKIMSPILGARHCVMKRTENIDEQFNDWLSNSLLVAVDEFNASDTKSKSAIVNKLKNYITEDHTPIRRMRTDQVDIRNYANFIFFSNDDAPIVIQEGDRRFNVCPRQSTALNKAHPNIDEDIRTKLPNELPHFAAFLLSFDYSVLYAQRALENEAKEKIKAAGRTTAEEFADALRNHDLNYFLEVLDRRPAANLYDTVLPAQNILIRWLRDYQKNPEKRRNLFVDELRVLYTAMVGRMESTKMFGKLLSRRNIHPDRKMVNGRRAQCVQVVWNLQDCNIDELLRYLDGVDAENVAPFAKNTA